MLQDFKAYNIAVEFYQLCKSVKAPVFLQDQLQRASASIVLNLAESSGNRSDKERRRYFAIALGSLRECQAILQMEGVKTSKIWALANHLGPILHKLCRLPAKSHPSETPTNSQQAAVSALPSPDN